MEERPNRKKFKELVKERKEVHEEKEMKEEKGESITVTVIKSNKCTR